MCSFDACSQSFAATHTHRMYHFKIQSIDRHHHHQLQYVNGGILDLNIVDHQFNRQKPNAVARDSYQRRTSGQSKLYAKTIPLNRTQTNTKFAKKRKRKQKQEPKPKVSDWVRLAFKFRSHRCPMFIYTETSHANALFIRREARRTRFGSINKC